MKKTGTRTLEQRRASNALSRTAELANKVLADKPADFKNEFKNRYRAYVDRLGPAIVMNGLGQALATELAAAGPNPRNAGECAHSELYAGLHRWLCRKGGGVYPGRRDLLRAITQHDEQRYLLAQAEALAWLEWHKKCCRASFPKGEED